MNADKYRRVPRPPTAAAKRAPVRRPRKLARPELDAGPQRDVRDLLYDLREKAGRPTLEDLEKRIARDDRLDGSPKKDVIHQIISQGGPAALDDVRAVAQVLALACGEDKYKVVDRVTQLMYSFDRPSGPSRDESSDKTSAPEPPPAADMTAVVVARPETGEAPGHLFVADWVPMLGDDVAFTLTGIIESVHVEVPLLTDWLTAELARRSASDIPDDDVKKQILRPVRMAKGRSERLGPELVRLARAAHAARYTDAEIRTILNRALSFKVNVLLSSADHPGYPHPLDLGEIAAFTFGYAKKDLIELGFNAGRGRGGVQAYVPREILLNSPELMEIGTLLAPAASSTSARLYRACQLARDFSFIGLADQRHLWTHFVLPQAFARYPFDAVIVEAGSIRTFGLP
ncbi:hypothetical protein [Micromonospora sp. NPDC050495]|uniref:hypothetical protein n=1 Tax=Micromonospora sp. NPDC050495 TaxID=3154936 RepID=UPI0034030114